MPTTERTRDRGQRQADRFLTTLGVELRDARLAAGVSQRHVAEVTGLSQPAVSRIEHARSASVSLRDLAVHSAALGLRLSVKAYPDGSPVRDEAQLRLLQRFRAQLHREFRWTAEAPIGACGDLRAWDLRLHGPGSIGVDAETRLHDLQALERRCHTKRRDSRVDKLVLLVAATHHNRAVLRDHREALRSTFPVDTAAVMAALRAGLMPPADGIVVL